MSRISDITFLGQFTYHGVDRRTAEEIQNKIIEQNGRYSIFLLFHAGNDREVIVAWKSRLNEIFTVFNVCCVLLLDHR